MRVQAQATSTSQLGLRRLQRAMCFGCMTECSSSHSSLLTPLPVRFEMKQLVIKPQKEMCPGVTWQWSADVTCTSSPQFNELLCAGSAHRELLAAPLGIYAQMFFLCGV